MKPRILVTPAAGKTGSQVVRHLIEEEFPVRAGRAVVTLRATQRSPRRSFSKRLKAARKEESVMKKWKRNVAWMVFALVLSAASPPAGAEPHPGIPGGFVPPLDPTGIELKTKRLAPGVYALLAGHGAVDNSGFVVGDRGVLVIDAHINGAMARQIQAAVRRVTDKPILYLVNTNFHGDHTFGNYAFPASTQIVAHRKTAERMRHFEEEKALILLTVNNKSDVLADVRLRIPDVVFDSFMWIDLGGRVVEVHHFGAGNTPGDTVIYVPEARVAWTGNLVVGEGMIPPIFEGNASAYLKTIARFAAALEVETIIPGHGALATGSNLSLYVHYLSDLIQAVRRAVREGKTLEETVAQMPGLKKFAPPKDHPLNELIAGLHRRDACSRQSKLAGDGGAPTAKPDGSEKIEATIDGSTGHDGARPFAAAVA